MTDIEIEHSEGIVTVTLHRPPVNALSVSMMRELIEALRWIDSHDEARVAILTGRGKCFCAGVDLKEQLGALENGGEGPLDVGVAMYEALLGCKKPLIAAINGIALGAGVGLSASCNILVASDTTVMGLPEINVGALGGARHALRLFGHSTTNRMLLTGHRIGAAELKERRVVEAVLPPAEVLPYARAIAAEIASKDPLAIALAKQCLAQVEGLSVLEGYRLESGMSEQLARTENGQALMRAFAFPKGK
jgi:enoyl-CoA hydratase